MVLLLGYSADVEESTSYNQAGMLRLDFVKPACLSHRKTSLIPWFGGALNTAEAALSRPSSPPRSRRSGCWAASVRRE